jgi:hypothetical protein
MPDPKGPQSSLSPDVTALEFFTLPDTPLLQPSDLEGNRIGYKTAPELFALLYEFVAKNSPAQGKLLPIESDDPLQDLLLPKGSRAPGSPRH